MTERPLLSVVLPVYNGEKYIDTIIEAFNNQTDKDFELIFIDDGSADGSHKKISDYIGKTDFPVILERQENQGVSAARNNGAKLASGKYITFADCDDSIVNDYVEILRKAAESDFDVFAFRSLMLGEHDELVPEITDKSIKPMSRYDMLGLFISNPTAFGVCNLFIDRDFYLRSGSEFRNGYKYYEDYDFLYRIFSQTDNIGFTEYQMYFYIRRENSAMARFVPERLSCMSLIEELEGHILEHAPEFLPVFKKWGTARLYWSVMWQASLAFGLKDALHFAKRAHIKQYMRKLNDYKAKKVRLSARLFRFSPLLFILSAKLAGRSHSKVEKCDIGDFDRYFDRLPKKVLVYGMTENFGGIESYIMNLYRTIDKSALTFDFLTDWETMAFEEEVKRCGSEVFHIPAKSKSLSAHQKAISKILKDHAEYRTVYFNILNAGAFFSVLPCLMKGRKTVIHSHNSSDCNMKLHRLCKLPLNIAANKKIACSEPAAVHMFGKKALEKGKVTLIRNAIKISDYSFNPDVRKAKRAELGLGDEFTVIHVGRMSEEKNPVFLIDIFSAIVSVRPNSVLLYAGAGALEEKIKAHAKAAGISDNIRFLGLRRDINELLQAADVFLLPSLFEGLPISAIEAQAADLNCFISDNVSKEIALTNRVYLLSLDLSASAWAEKITEIGVSDRKNREAEITEKGYNLNVEAEKVTDILK